MLYDLSRFCHIFQRYVLRRSWMSVIILGRHWSGSRKSASWSLASSFVSRSLLWLVSGVDDTRDLLKQHSRPINGRLIRSILTQRAHGMTRCPESGFVVKICLELRAWARPREDVVCHWKRDWVAIVVETGNDQDLKFSRKYPTGLACWGERRKERRHTD